MKTINTILSVRNTTSEDLGAAQAAASPTGQSMETASPSADTLTDSPATTRQAMAVALGLVSNVSTRPAASAQSREVANLIRYYDAWMGTDKNLILSFYANPDDPKGLQD